MMGRFLEHWAVILLSSLTVLLVALICETSWPIAYVYLLSSPGGARVFDGDAFEWYTPAWVPVSHQGLAVTISHPGRQPVDTVLTPIMSDAPVLVTLPYLFGLTVTSDPPGASIFIDGSYEGTTPVKLEMTEPGTHHLELTLGDMIMVTDSFSLLANTPDSMHYFLPRPFGDRLVLVPAGSCHGEGVGHSFMIARHEVTNREFCRYLRWLEPVPLPDSTIRWGRTEVVERMFPGDYPLPFYIDSTGQWAIMEGMEEHPLTGITVEAALDYCDWYSVLDGSGLAYRLPTPEEWRAAALGGGTGPWPWGDERPDGRLLNLSDSREGLLRRHPSLDDGFAATAPVGSFPCNGWGLYDMAGNVWEYCMTGDGSGMPVAMGGGWLSSMEDCRCDAVMVPDTSLGYPYIGFRLSATPEAGPSFR